MLSINNDPHPTEVFWFPGRWIGGTSMIIAPILLLTGGLLRLQFDFFFPQQLKAFQEYPTLIFASYSCFLAGNILLWPAIMTLSRLIGQTKPGWALWGGTFVILGLFARTFHYGINHLAFQLVKIHNLSEATKTVADAYGAFHIVSALSGAIMFGWILLGIGAYLSGILNLIQSIALGLMSTLMLGVLKGSSIASIVALTGLCIALLPLGVKVLKDGPRPTTRSVLSWIAIIIVVTIAMFFFGQAG